MGYTSYVKQAKDHFDDWEEKALEAIGFFIDAEAVLKCPVGMYSGKVGGNLRGSIKHIVRKSEHAAIIGTETDYAIYVEKGTGIYAVKGDGRKTGWFYVDDIGKWHFTRGMKPQPFLGPAGEGNANRIDAIVRKVKFANGIK